VDDLDEALHAERLDADRRRRTYAEPWERLPDGAMVADDADAYLVHRGGLRRWTPAGYEPPGRVPPAAGLRVLTPRSTVAAIRGGYGVLPHSSAR
jgi:hypothetical protein